MIPKKIREEMLAAFQNDCKYYNTQLYGYIKPRPNGEFTFTVYAVKWSKRFGIRMTEVNRCWSDRPYYQCKNIWKNFWGQTMIEFDERKNRPDESYGWYGGKWGNRMAWKAGDSWFVKYIRYKNLDALSETKYKYCAFDQYYKCGGELILPEYCRLFTKYPSVEILSKNGMSHLVKESFLRKLTENKKLRDFFRCNAKRISYSNGMTPTVIERACSRGWTLEKAQEYEFARCYYSKAPKGVNRLELHKYLTEHNIDRYDWYHYAETVKSAGLDILAYGTTFPRDFHEAERRIRRRIQRRVLRENKKREAGLMRVAERINELVAKMKLRLDARVGNLTVVVPTTQKEFTAEGHAMKNCIGGYYEISMHGGSMCFFIRKDGKRCADVEMSLDGKVRQCRGKVNKETSAEVRMFAEEVSREIAKEMKRKAA